MWHGNRAQKRPVRSGSRFLSTLENLRGVLFGDSDRQVQIHGNRVDVWDVESALCQHCSVDECAVVPREISTGSKELVAYVVPRHALVAVESTDTDLIGRLEVRRCTGQGIVEQEVSESLDQTVERLRALKPKRVLEIGCGTGLLLSRLAPFCEEYVATDVSAPALEGIKRALSTAGEMSPKVCLRQQAADDFSGIAPGTFDVVITKSATRTFLSIQDLVHFLEKAVSATCDGGVVFVGDIPSLPLLESCDVFSREAQAQGDETERELMVDPAFFGAFARRTLGIGYVNVLLKRGHHAHRLPRVRYDVLLHVGEATPEQVPVEWKCWDSEILSLASLQDLCKAPDDIFAFQGIPNKRLRSDGVDPEDFWSFAEKAGFEADITWSDVGETGSFDVVLRRGEMMQARAIRAHADPMPWDAYANLPARTSTRGFLISRWREYLQQIFPGYMVPAEFIIAESLPHTSSGEIDRRALRLRASSRQAAALTNSIFDAESREKSAGGTRMQEYIAI